MQLNPENICEDPKEKQEFEMLKRTILKAIGLNCDYYRDSYLRRRINYRMKNKGISSYQEYSRLLKSNPEEFSLLIKDLTINYTKFFRDPDVFSYFQKNILPEILAKKKIVRILSAGCSSGEEPYTISIIVNEALGPRINAYVISIYAVDIDDECLKKAENAEYEQQEVAEIGAGYLQKYFIQNGAKYRVKDNVKRLVHFKHADLTQKLPYQNIDVIFCRNVFIYFAKSGQAQIFKNFYEALISGGYLIIGKTEMLPDEVRNSFKCINAQCKIFQKNDEKSLLSNTLTLCYAFDSVAHKNNSDKPANTIC